MPTAPPVGLGFAPLARGVMIPLAVFWGAARVPDRGSPGWKSLAASRNIGTRLKAMSLRNVRISLWMLVSIAVIAGGGVAIWRNTDNVMPHNAQDVARAAISGRFSLVDHTGKSVSDADFRGEWLLVFFGYTHCPDVCPTTLGTIAAVMDELGEQAANVRPLFITVDPERDTPEVMADYASAFHPKMVGLTGSVEQVRSAAKGYRVYFAKAGQDEFPGDYLMDHSAFVYLMNPQGKFEAVFSDQNSVEKIVGKIREYL